MFTTGQRGFKLAVARLSSTFCLGLGWAMLGFTYIWDFMPAPNAYGDPAGGFPYVVFALLVILFGSAAQYAVASGRTDFLVRLLIGACMGLGLLGLFVISTGLAAAY